MKKDVLMKLVSTQSVDGESTETELITQAVFEKTGEDSYKIEYAESEATGFKGSKTTLTVDGDRQVSVDRTGKSASNLIVEKDVKHHCHYGTPYGDFTVGINTNAIVNELNESGGKLYLNYTVDINTSYISDNEILIVI